MSHAKPKMVQPSRHELIEWINNTIQAQLLTIQDLGSGAVFCQLLNYAHPNSIPAHRINFQATNTYEFLINFKLLQTSFQELGIHRPLPMQALARAQYKDNFELAVWLYGYVNGQLQETDCTISSQGVLPIQIDFSFSRRRVQPKYFTPRRCQRDRFCCCCVCKEKGQSKLRQRVRELEVKFEMMQEVLASGEEPQEMCFLIEEIIGLSV